MYLHSFLTSALDGSGKKSRPGHYTSGNELRYPSNRKQGGPQSHAGCFEEYKNSLVPAGMRTPPRSASSLVVIQVPANVHCVN
jgi:hypothetical protein